MTMKVSEVCISFIKDMEGFIKFPVWDYAQYSVGYGCRCEKGEYPNGITEAEADALLRQMLTQFEAGINGIGQPYTQNQFDALVSFSFNVGLAWTKNSSYRIYKLVHGTQYTDAEVFDIFGSWSSAGGQKLSGLVRRREAEARMWLYGDNSVNSEVNTEAQLREKVVAIMRGWLGCKQGDKTQHYIVDTYNSIRPLPMGYKLSYSEAWCAATVSAAGYLAGMQEIIFPHMNCGSLVSLFKKAGKWVEDDAYIPKPGDLPVYDWTDNGVGDCTAHASHVGMVEWCDGKQFSVMEGNMGSGHVCGRRIMDVNGKYIRGFCCPDYKSLATAEEEIMYHTLKDVPCYLRKEVDELIARGSLTGKGGEGEDLILDYSEGDIRTMVVMRRDISKSIDEIKDLITSSVPTVDIDYTKLGKAITDEILQRLNK